MIDKHHNKPEICQRKYIKEIYKLTKKSLCRKINAYGIG